MYQIFDYKGAISTSLIEVFVNIFWGEINMVAILDL